MKSYRPVAEFSVIEGKIVEAFGCDSQNAYITKCPNCPIKGACYLESKQGENSKDFNHRWEKAMVEAFNAWTKNEPTPSANEISSSK